MLNLHSMRDRRRTVVVTGASAGLGRAIAVAFGEEGARVALLARGESGLQAAAKDVEAAGGTALVVPTDTADHDAVRRAATIVADEFGDVDVWVNVAFTSVFAPFTQIEPDEFRRVTDVTYLGFVNGTREALRLMRPRNRGTIVQVGSALAYRGIPLQSAYCGAKHAMVGFTESVRTELMHEHSKVRITMVQMPAVNTPQFEWVLSRLPRRARPVAPIYQPEVGAQAVVFASHHPRRRAYWVGASTIATIVGNRVAGGLLDRYLGRVGYSAQQTNETEPTDAPSNLWHALDDTGLDFGAHGPFDAESHAQSRALTLVEYRPLITAGAAAGLVGSALAIAGIRARLRSWRVASH
jgi:NAD(P)-dependent dehydrogenase (short-subunit alcohol dehydrogenase family)